MEIYELNKNNEKAWDEYVYHHPNSTFYHQVGWKYVVEKTYGNQPHYLIAEDGGHIQGILPLILVQNRFFGNRLVSVPFAPYGGVLASDGSIEEALMERAKKLTKELNADYMELRKNAKLSNYDGLIQTSHYLTSILKLDPNPEVVMEERLSRNKRKTISKSQKRELSVKWSMDTSEFYEIFMRNMRDLGSPAQSRRFFDNIIHEFPDNSRILEVEKDGITVYAAFYLFYKGTMINSWSSALMEYRKFYPTDLGIWTAIKYGCEKGYNYYDFGRSQRDSSNLEFKERWGAEIMDIYYYYYLRKGNKVPDNTSINPNRQIFSQIWKKIPIMIAKRIGPEFRKLVP